MKNITTTLTLTLLGLVLFSCSDIKPIGNNKSAQNQTVEVADSAVPKGDKKPNVVLVLADDMSWYDIGAYHKQFDYVPKNAKTPNIDKIAEQGMMFTRSFTATAMCAVTRQQLYTGIYPVRNGAYGNHTRVHDGVKSVAHYFKDLGYRVGLAGKKHIAPFESFPFEMAGKQNRLADGETSFGIDTTREFIKRDSSQPFFLIVASSSPHDPWTRGDRSQYPENELQVPDFLNDTKEVRRLMADYLAEVSDLDREVGLVETELANLRIKDDTVFIFTSEQGSVLPFGKWSNYDAGLKTAFIIRWPNKISAGTKTDAMIEYVDIVPTLTDLVNSTVPEGLDGKSFKNVLLGKETEHKEYVYGVQTTYNVKEGSEYPVRSVRSQQFKLIHNLQFENDFSNLITASPWFQRELVAEKNAQISNYADFVSRPEFELYDVINDPLEQINLINKPQLGNEIAHLQQKLRQWMTQQGDSGIAMEKAVCERKAFPHGPCGGKSIVNKFSTMTFL